MEFGQKFVIFFVIHVLTFPVIARYSFPFDSTKVKIYLYKKLCDASTLDHFHLTSLCNPAVTQKCSSSLVTTTYLSRQAKSLSITILIFPAIVFLSNP